MSQNFLTSGDLYNRVSNFIDMSESIALMTAFLDRTYRAKTNLIEHGYFPGAQAPYGLARVEVSRNDLGSGRLLGSMRSARVRGTRVILRSAGDATTEAVRLVFRSLEQGMSTRQVVRLLTDGAYPPPGGTQWQTRHVRRIATNKIYMGTLVWGRERMSQPRRLAVEQAPLVREGFVKDPPVNAEQFRRVQELLQQS